MVIIADGKYRTGRALKKKLFVSGATDFLTPQYLCARREKMLSVLNLACLAKTAGAWLSGALFLKVEVW